VLKDGIGMFGGILFAGKFGSKFDNKMKMWRVFSFELYSFAFLLDFSILLYPQHFLLIAGLSNILKSICCITSSASSGSISQYFAKSNNMADVTGKTLSQATFGSIIGLELNRVYYWVSNIAFNITSQHKNANPDYINCLCY
jgi:Vitamin B6 photo-protection and homoeostasis